jgi:glycosyltransferase involved in cell wall biosynthesis
MNILQVNAGTGWSGGQHQIFLLSRGLMERGHHVVVACDGKSVLAQKAAEAGIPVEPVSIGSHIDPAAARRLFEIIRRHRIDIVNPHKPKPHTQSLIGVLLARGSLRRNPVFRPRLVTTRRVSFPIRRHPLRNLLWDRYVDRIIAVAKRIEAVLIGSGLPPEKIRTIYGAVDTKRFHPVSPDPGIAGEFGLKPGTPVIGKVGDYRKWKGYAVFLEAAARVLAEVPEARFFAVGKKTDYYNEMEALVRRLGIERQVIFTGFRPDVERFYSVMALSVNAATGGEGIPGVLRESMAMEIPVVAADTGGNRELVADGETGLLVPPNDPGALASAILRLLRDGSLRRILGMNGRRLIEDRFSIQSMVSQTEALYESVLHPG